MIRGKSFREIFDLAADAMLILDQNRIIKEINTIAHEQLGYTKAEMLGRPISDFVLPEYVALMTDRFFKVKSHGFLIYESAMIHKDGSILPVEIGNRIIELDGQIAFFAVARDITERKRLDNALKESEARFRILSEDAPEAIAIMDLDSGLFIDATNSAERLFGYSREEILRHGPGYFYAPIQPENSPPVDSIRERGERTLAGEQMRFERLVRNRDCQDILCEVTLVRLPSEKQKLIRVSYYDITKRKQDEMVLLQHKVAIDTTHDGFWITDGQGILLDVNQAYANISGYSLDELRGMHISQFEAKEKTLDEIKAHITKIISQGWDVFETRHRHKNGHEIELEVSASFIPESKQIVSFLRDITERKQAEAELRIAATAFESDEGMMITDAQGVILRVNQAFTKDTGYTAEEAVGQTPSLLKSGRHDAAFYQAMWQNINQTGTWQGEIWDRRKNGEIYPKWLTVTAVKDNNGVVTHYVGIHVDITERKFAEKEIQLLAYYDPLTRLPNRRLLMDRLQQAMASGARTGREGALLLIDLDNFKTLNDTLGHQVGDQLLQQIAQRLEACVRDGDTVARLGGDEFVVILENLSEHAFEAATQTEAVGEKILAALSQPYQFATHEHQSTASIGATLFDDKHQAINELLKQADIAMYQAKKAGRNTLRFFDPKMQASITARVSLESELRRALEGQQFQLHYQIQMDSLHHPIGAEALIRWLHPERGMVSPIEFIPLAEDTGLILPIGHWVLDTACAQIRAWQQHPLTQELSMAVNVSARQFRQADFVAQVEASLQRHGIIPRRLKLELTESMLLEDIEEIIVTMNALKAIGVQFSLDDFGTGYSSLQYLKRLPLDQLKIDRSFVRDIVTDSSDKAIVRTIIAMAQSMDISVIAEGVETEEQRQLLLKSGCSNFQGYLFSKPVPIEQFETLLKQG